MILTLRKPKQHITGASIDFVCYDKLVMPDLRRQHMQESFVAPVYARE
jgi:hypothetical protein